MVWLSLVQELAAGSPWALVVALVVYLGYRFALARMVLRSKVVESGKDVAVKTAGLSVEVKAMPPSALGNCEPPTTSRVIAEDMAREPGDAC